MAKITDYAATSIKNTHGREGSGFIAFLTRDGKKVAEVANYGDGGPTRIDFLDAKVPRVDGPYRHYEGEIKTRSMTPEEAIFYAMIIDLPKYKCSFSEDMCFKNDEIAVDTIINNVLSAKRLTNMLKKKLVFIRDGSCYTGVLGDVEKLTAQVLAKHPTAKILNNLPFAEALELAREARAV